MNQCQPLRLVLELHLLWRATSAAPGSWCSGIADASQSALRGDVAVQIDCRDGAATHGVGGSIVSGQLINTDQHAPALLSVTPRVRPHKAFEVAAAYRRLPPITHSPSFHHEGRVCQLCPSIVTWGPYLPTSSNQQPAMG